MGAKVALGILGALSGDALATAIQRQDKAMLFARPGGGAKAAERVWSLELKDIAPTIPATVDFGGAPRSGEEPVGKLPRQAEDAVLALVGLGYARAQAAAAVAKGFAALGPDAQTAALIRLGLKELAQ